MKVFVTLALPEYEYKVKPIKEQEFGKMTEWEGKSVRNFYRGFEFKEVHRIEKVIVDGQKKRNSEKNPCHHITCFDNGKILLEVGDGYSAKFDNLDSLIKNLKYFA